MPKTRRTEPAELKGFRIEWGSYYGDILSFGEFNGHEGMDIRWMARNLQIVNCRNVILNVVKNLLKSVGTRICQFMYRRYLFHIILPY